MRILQKAVRLGCGDTNSSRAEQQQARFPEQDETDLAGCYPPLLFFMAVAQTISNSDVDQTSVRFIQFSSYRRQQLSGDYRTRPFYSSYGVPTFPGGLLCQTLKDARRASSADGRTAEMCLSKGCGPLGQLLRERTRTPLLLTGYAVVVAIHLCA